MCEMITSSSNTIIKEIKSLHRKKDRWAKNSFFVEGVRGVEDCIKSGIRVEYLVYSDMLLSTNGGQQLLEEISYKDYKIYYISDKLFKEVSDTEKPQGILAVVKLHLKNIKEALLEKNNFLVLLDRIQDPGNLGTIIRTADAFGANGVIVTEGCVDVFNPKTIRSTMGSIFHVPIIYYGCIKEAIRDLKAYNIKIITTSLAAKKYSYEIDFNTSFSLVIGNEASGVSEEVIEASDSLIKIPMTGQAESLNAAIASSVIMYEALRQKAYIQKNHKI